MLSIRREQRQKVGELAFEERTADFCRRCIEPHVARLDDRRLLLRVRHCIARARSYGLSWESSITAFVLHMLSIGPEFDKQPVIQRVLRDESIPVDDRMTAMLGLVDDDDWEEAAALGDEKAYWKNVDRTETKES